MDSVAVAVDLSVAAPAVAIGVGVVGLHHTKRVAQCYDSTLLPSRGKDRPGHAHSSEGPRGGLATESQKSQ